MPDFVSSSINVLFKGANIHQSIGMFWPGPIKQDWTWWSSRGLYCVFNLPVTTFTSLCCLIPVFSSFNYGCWNVLEALTLPFLIRTVQCSHTVLKAGDQVKCLFLYNAPACQFKVHTVYISIYDFITSEVFYSASSFCEYGTIKATVCRICLWLLYLSSFSDYLFLETHETSLVRTGALYVLLFGLDQCGRGTCNRCNNISWRFSNYNSQRQLFMSLK